MSPSWVGTVAGSAPWAIGIWVSNGAKLDKRLWRHT